VRRKDHRRQVRLATFSDNPHHLSPRFIMHQNKKANEAARRLRGLEKRGAKNRKAKTAALRPRAKPGMSSMAGT
jgi:hypothetical protein